MTDKEQQTFVISILELSDRKKRLNWETVVMLAASDMSGVRWSFIGQNLNGVWQ
jgi:hypothetical protein